MSAKAKADRDRERAANLQRQAENCVSIVAAGGTPRHSGELIDEAIRLARRAKELRGG